MKKKCINLINKIPNKYYLYLLLFALLIPCFTSNFTFAKYVFEDAYNNYLISKEFYFESPHLDGSTHSVYDWDGTSTYPLTFEIRNYADLLRWTGENISYTINISCTPSITGSVACSTDSNTGTIVYSADNGTTNNINVTMSNSNNLVFSDNDYVDMRVTATSTSPYRKSLYVDFRIYVVTRKVAYKIEDAEDSEFLSLTIANQTTSAKNITVSWDYSVVAVDNLRKVIAEATLGTYVSNGVTYVNSFTTSIPAKASFLVRYYKADITQDYTYGGSGGTPVITLTEN